MLLIFFFQAEDGIRDLVRSRGLGDVYKRQALGRTLERGRLGLTDLVLAALAHQLVDRWQPSLLSLIHI